MKDVEHYDALVDLLRTKSSSSVFWDALLRLSGKSSVDALKSLDVQGDIGAVADQLSRIWASEPIPEGTTFLYFGLYDLVEKGSGNRGVGFYVSGGNGLDPIRQLEDGNLSYLPKRRQIHSHILGQIIATEKKVPGQTDVLGYALRLGAAALLARDAVESLDVLLPVYAGFDSGDVLLASSPR